MLLNSCGVAKRRGHSTEPTESPVAQFLLELDKGLLPSGKLVDLNLGLC